FPNRALTCPGPAVTPDGQEDEYYVERIVDEHIRYRKRQLKVRWHGYGPEDDDWIDAAEL
ncbi:hypothetical protein C8F01DRAFT_948060, partial [Mycena amicta]